MNKGGTVIGSGGFGCIFRPSLSCKNGPIKSDAKITKLMMKNEQDDEYDQLQRYLKVITSIPSYSDYFVVDNVSKCEHPSKLSSGDLDQYDSKCTALKKHGITRRNVNSNLAKLVSVTMPFAGVDMLKYLAFRKANKNLYKKLEMLLSKAIVPMNKKGLYHCDLKAANILISVDGMFLRMIDWGLSTLVTRDGTVPKAVTTRPFQFNMPFSTIILHGPLRLESDQDLYDYVVESVASSSHFHAIESIFHDVGIVDAFVPICTYLKNIFSKFDKGGRFDITQYVDNVFLKNVDVWGFVMICFDCYVQWPKASHNSRVFTDLFLYMVQCDAYAMDVSVVKAHVHKFF